MYRKKIYKLLVSIITCTILILCYISLKFSNIPDNLFIVEGEEQSIDVRLPISVNVNSDNKDILKLNGSNINKSSLSLYSPINMTSIKNGIVNFNIEFLGFIPLKNITVNVVSKTLVIPGGQPIGVKVTTKGTMIVGLSEVEGCDNKTYNPAMDAGIEIGDIIEKINDIGIKSGEHVSNIINSCEGKEIKLLIKRKDKEIEKIIKPVKSKQDDKYKAGMWIRDSTAGVGTLTFFNPQNNTFGALGHPITDIDTGIMLSIDKGEIIPSKIISIQPGLKGKPGELRGMFFDDEKDIGEIKNNTSCGIFGLASDKIVNNIYDEPIPIAYQSEIKEGPAEILTTLDGNDVKRYSILIERKTVQNSPNPKSMIIKITDKELLDKTGGIVQGMSGSPIIQDGKLVGAVTHVFINRPDMGYGIYIEWMIHDADSIKNLN